MEKNTKSFLKSFLAEELEKEGNLKSPFYNALPTHYKNTQVKTALKQNRIVLKSSN